MVQGGYLQTGEGAGFNGPTGGEEGMGGFGDGSRSTACVDQVSRRTF